jgi:hypothetical protein
MRIMYDSIHPALIPSGAEMVAGYVSGPHAWPAAGWARFPRAAHVRIDVDGTQPFASDVIDVERFDMTPGGAALWVRQRQQARGWWSAAYCSLFTLPALRDAMGDLQCEYWVAQWTGHPHEIAGRRIIAVQYANTPDYDLTIVDNPRWFPAPGQAQ